MYLAKRPSSVVCFVAAATAAMCGELAGSERPQVRVDVPLPVVRRTTASGKNPFETAPVVVRAWIRERAEVEDVGFEGQTVDGTYWTYVRAQLVDVVRVNERKPEDPSLSQSFFWIEQKARKDKPIRFEFTREYLLFLKPSEALMRLRAETSIEPEPYELATPQGGFWIDRGRLRVLERGGPLDLYDSRLLHDVIKEVRGAGN